MRAIAAFGLFLFTACEPTIQGSTTSVFAVVPTSSGKLEQRMVVLQYASSIVHFTGPNMTFVGGAQLVVDQGDPMFATGDDAQLEDVIAKNHGGSVRGSFLDRGGALVPTDFHTWAMTTTWYNFEKAFDYFQKIYDGKPTDELRKARTFYWASYQIAGLEGDRVDNAAWEPLVKSFIVMPIQKDNKLPLSMNLGVIGHEFSHLVFNKRVYSGAAKPAPYFAQQWSGAPFNLLISMDEGIADFHGFSVTCGSDANCNPRFLGLSFDTTTAEGQKAVAARDLSDDTKCMTKELRNALNTFQGAQFQSAGLQYKVGTLIAAALYSASEPDGKQDSMRKALIDALEDEKAATPGFKQFLSLNLEKPSEFTPEVMTDIIASHIPDLSLRNKFCGQMMNHLDLDQTKIPSAELTACVSAARASGCPVLPQ